MLEINKGTEKGNAEVEASCHAADDENDKSDDLEVGEDALTYDAKRIKFGNLGFISFSGESAANGNCTPAQLSNEDAIVSNEDINHRSEVTNNNDHACVVAEPVDEELDIDANDIVEDIAEEVAQIVTSSKRTKKRKEPVIHVRNKAKKKRESDPLEKSDAAAKKGFKDNLLTVKFKLSSIQAKAGKSPDFALFIKDDLHHPDAKNAAGHAGRYIAYMKGDLCDDFFSKKGIKFHPDNFFICKNEFDLREDRLLPHQKTNISMNDEANDQPDQPAQPAQPARPAQPVQPAQPAQPTQPDLPDLLGDDHPHQPADVSETVDGGKDDAEYESEGENSDSVEEEFDIFDAGKNARQVAFGAMNTHNSEDSFSSAGVVVYGRGAEKTTSKEKKDKKSKRKKHLRESAEKTRRDILENDGFIPMGTGRGQERGRGRGVRGQGRGRGRGGRDQGRGRGGRDQGRGRRSKTFL